MQSSDTTYARQLLEAGLVDYALSELRRHLVDDIGDVPVLALFIQTLLAKSVPMKPKWAVRANGLLDQLQRHEALDAAAAAQLGRFLLSRGEVAVARAICATLPNSSDSEEIPIFKVSLHEQIGEPAAALEIIRAAAARWPEHRPWKITLARRLLAIGSVDEAAAQLEPFAQDIDGVDLCLVLANLRCRVGDIESVPSLAARAANQFGAPPDAVLALARRLRTVGRPDLAKRLIELLGDWLPDTAQVARLRLELAPELAQDTQFSARVHELADPDLLSLLAEEQIKLNRVDLARRTSDRLSEQFANQPADQLVQSALLRAEGADDAARLIEDRLIAEAIGTGTVELRRTGPVRILGIIGATGLGDFVYQILALASIKRQFSNGWLTLMFNNELAYKDDVIRFCPDVDEVRDYAKGALNIPVSTKQWQEYRHHLIFTQFSLSPTLLSRFPRTATLAAPSSEGPALEQQLIARGLDPARWFAVLHYRQSSTFNAIIPGTRDVDGATFHDLAREICAAGGQVARLGHAGTDPLPDVEGYIDLTGAPVALQLYATSRARFMVGCDSGPSSFATAFKTPLFKTNTFSEDGAFYPHDLVLAKNIVTWRDEVLSFGELMEDRFIFLKKLPTYGGALKVVDNTLAQLRHGVDIMMDQTADCLGWRSPAPQAGPPAPEALSWPYWTHRGGRWLDLSDLAGRPVRPVPRR